MERLMRAKEILTAEQGIHFGIPRLPSQESSLYSQDPFEPILVPMRPHVFLVRDLLLNEFEENIDRVHDVMVMLAHGTSFTAPDGQESFQFIGTGKSVYETVDAYEEFATQGIVPHIDYVLACRGTAPARARRDGPLVIHPQRPLLIQPDHKEPQVYPGSLVQVGSSWRRASNGVEGMVVNATEWQGLRRWKDYWQEQGRNRSPVIFPEWTKVPARQSLS